MPDHSIALDFAPSMPSQVVAFDEARVRPGLRRFMQEARRRLEDARTSGAFSSRQAPCRIEDLIDLLPNDDELFSASDAAAAKSAIDCSLLALHAIHAQQWDVRDEIPFFMQLQAIATRLSEHPEVTTSAAQD